MISPPKKLSIIVPVYNAEKTLNYCLESLIDHSLFGNYEIICINDGSSDNSHQILNQWQCKYPNLFKIINKKNEGVSSARNIGIEASQGKWIFFCDSDDYIARNSMSNLLSYIKDYPSDVKLVSFGGKHIYSQVVLDNFSGCKGSVLYEKNVEYFQTNLFWTCWKFLYRRDLINTRFKPVKASEDQLFNCQILLNGVFKVLKIDADIYRYVNNKNSVTNTFSKAKAINYIKDHLIVYSEYQKLPPTNSPTDLPSIRKRMEWVVAKNLPNVFSRMLHSEMS